MSALKTRHFVAPWTSSTQAMWKVCAPHAGKILTRQQLLAITMIPPLMERP
jgi:hypothetical protein